MSCFFSFLFFQDVLKRKKSVFLLRGSALSRRQSKFLAPSGTARPNDIRHHRSEPSGGTHLSWKFDTIQKYHEYLVSRLPLFPDLASRRSHGDVTGYASDIV
jgi:hypothetical protein